jgi:hypothetical protein
MPRTYTPVPAGRHRKPGPKTILGKMRSAANSLKHGLFAQKGHIVRRIRTEGMREYDRLRRDFRPKTALQRQLLRLYGHSTARVAWLDRWLDHHADPKTHKVVDQGDTRRNTARKLRARWATRIDAGLRLWCQVRRENTQLLSLVIQHFSERPLTRIRGPNVVNGLVAMRPPKQV